MSGFLTGSPSFWRINGIDLNGDSSHACEGISDFY